MVIKIKFKMIIIFAGIILIAGICMLPLTNSAQSASATSNQEKDFIKWVDFRVSYEAMDKALKADILSTDEEVKLNWIEILAYLGTRYGGNFSIYKSKDMDDLITKLKNGESIENLTKDLKYYDYYYEAYSAILGNFVGPYEIQVENENNPGEKIWERRYGLKVFSPIAAGYNYSHYDDFGNSRSYGFRRVHLGNDLLGSIGTPVVAVETGRIEALGWNQYGGWRIGIRSLDDKRYYYYAHLRKGHPYVKSLKEGDIVYAGDVIGYLGMTGYSRKEDVNNINVPHLHFGTQLIFDESQKETLAEIWVNVYDIVELLNKNRSPVTYDEKTKECERIYDIRFHNVPERTVKTDKTIPST